MTTRELYNQLRQNIINMKLETSDASIRFEFDSAIEVFGNAPINDWSAVPKIKHMIVRVMNKHKNCPIIHNYGKVMVNLIVDALNNQEDK